MQCSCISTFMQQNFTNYCDIHCASTVFTQKEDDCKCKMLSHYEACLHRKCYFMCYFILLVQEKMWKIIGVWKHGTHYIYWLSFLLCDHEACSLSSVSPVGLTVFTVPNFTTFILHISNFINFFASILNFSSSSLPSIALDTQNFLNLLTVTSGDRSIGQWSAQKW